MSNNQEIQKKEQEVQSSDKGVESVSPQDLLKAQIADLEKRLEYAKKLEESTSHIEVQKRKFGAITDDNQRKQKVEKIKENRIRAIVYTLKQLGAFVKKQLDFSANTKDVKIGVNGLYMIYSIVFIIVVSITSFFIKQDNTFIFLGLIFMIWFILLFVSYNFLHTSLPHSYNLKDDTDLTYDYVTRHIKNQREDAFLVDSAWLEALEKEQARISQSVNELRMNRSLSEFEALLENKKMQLQELTLKDLNQRVNQHLENVETLSNTSSTVTSSGLTNSITRMDEQANEDAQSQDRLRRLQEIQQMEEDILAAL